MAWGASQSTHRDIPVWSMAEGEVCLIAATSLFRIACGLLRQYHPGQ
jgi:hypothetical protein